MKIFNLFSLKFTPLEFETYDTWESLVDEIGLKFTPLEFETYKERKWHSLDIVKIYSVGV